MSSQPCFGYEILRSIRNGEMNMKKNLGAAPLLFPQPVLIIATYDENEKANAMNAAWGGIVGKDKIIINLSSHKTTDNIIKRKAFTVSIGDKEHMIACDYVGIVSANKEPNKMEKAGFTTTKSKNVDAPVINELPMALECELLNIIEEDMYLAKIVNVVADESILSKEGKITLSKFFPITYDSSESGYYTLGERIGTAFKDGEKLTI